LKATAKKLRQKTPKNIVQIAELLLQSGADVNASADLYGGSTTLGLVATSLHPEHAGVQTALLQLLLDHGATLDTPDQPSLGIVSSCLANGRVQAAEFLAQRGAKLDLEAAAGVGRLDRVKSFFDDQSNLTPPATISQMQRGFLWACEYGRDAVVEFLLHRGVPLETEAGTGQTALHWSVIGGHVDTIKLLLDRGAQPEAKNGYGATALGQAVWSALHADAGIDYLPIIESLLKAGAQIEAGTVDWITQQKAASPTLKQRIAELLKRHGGEL
jgi:ankyrin repeat protein